MVFKLVDLTGTHVSLLLKGTCNNLIQRDQITPTEIWRIVQIHYIHRGIKSEVQNAPRRLSFQLQKRVTAFSQVTIQSVLHRALKKKPRSFNSIPWHFKLDLFFCTRHLFAVTWRGGKTFYVCALLKKKKKKKSCYPCYVFSPSHRQCLTASCSSAADFTQFWQKKNPPKHYYITLNSTPALCASFLLFWII